MLKSFTIDDDLSIQSTGAVEVTVEFADGQRRWCYFMTPDALAACGDSIDGTQVRFHYGSPHMIVVANPLDAEIIGWILLQIDREGKLEDCTSPLGEVALGPLI